jgi:UDP-2-acetamido-3-amino-2,3-dideoxy-glucuronate N-acetyltransferase
LVERIKASAQGSQGLAVIFAGAFIHPKAHVDCSTIGARSRVWQFASVIRGAIVGEDCNIATGACLDGSQIGDRVILGHNTAIGPGFRIFDDVFVGPGVVLCNDMWPRAWKDGFDVSRFNPVSYAVIIESRASIGANSVVLPGVRIGFGSMIAAGSVVTKDVPAKCLWKGGEIVQHNISERTRMRFANADVESFQ